MGLGGLNKHQLYIFFKLISKETNKEQRKATSVILIVHSLQSFQEAGYVKAIDFDCGD